MGAELTEAQLEAIQEAFERVLADLTTEEWYKLIREEFEYPLFGGNDEADND